MLCNRWIQADREEAQRRPAQDPTCQPPRLPEWFERRQDRTTTFHRNPIRHPPHRSIDLGLGEPNSTRTNYRRR